MSKRVICRSVLLGLALSGAVAFAVSADEKLIELGDVHVTQQEFERVVDVIAPEGRADALLADDRRARELLVEYFTAKVLAERARAEGLDQDERFRLRQAFEENRALASMYMVRAVDQMPRPDFEVVARETYQSNPDRFKTEEQVSARHVLVAVNEERTDDEAKALAEQVRAELLQGADFASLVERYSDDPSKENNGGNLGFFAHGRMVKPFSDTAFAMQPGEISEPVKTRFGYHIIELLERKPADVRPFEQVKEQLVKEAEARFEENARNELLAAVRGDDGIKTYHDAVDAMIQNR